MKQFDAVIIGGGLLGLSTAYQLLNVFPHFKIALIEKEQQVASHQSGHNSGVIHSGIYYKPGSLKAQNCVRGVQLLLDFCNTHNIPYKLCGKVIVATQKEELPRLYELYKRGIANGVKGLELINQKQLQEIEPYSNGIEAIYAPQTGIVDYKQVAQKLLEQIQLMGAEVFLGNEVRQIKSTSNEIVLFTPNLEITSKKLISCAGLQADRVANLTQNTIIDRIIPFRGEYYFLSSKASTMLNGLIYPVPNPKFPFLGVHLTKRITGEVEVGPNAVLAFAREGYTKHQIDIKDLAQTLSYRGFWAMSSQHWKTGLYELYRSYSKKTFLKDIQKLMPDLREEDLSPGGSGVRAQAVTQSGKIVDDFLIYQEKDFLHVINAPSPAATSCLSIAQLLIGKLYALNSPIEQTTPI